jgi:hypothetical protein
MRKIKLISSLYLCALAGSKENLLIIILVKIILIFNKEIFMNTCFFPSKKESYYLVPSEQQEEFENLIKVVENVQGVLYKEVRIKTMQLRALAFFVAATQACKFKRKNRKNKHRTEPGGFS